MVKALDSTGNFYFWNNNTKVWTHIGKGKLIEETVPTKNDTEVSDTVKVLKNDKTFSATFTITRGNTKTFSHNEAVLCYMFRTQYCNNWRKRHGKYVLRKRQINKYRLKTLRELLMEDIWDE